MNIQSKREKLSHSATNGASEKSAHMAELEMLAKDPDAIDEFITVARTAARHEDRGTLSDLIIKTLMDFRFNEEDEQFRNHCNFDCHSDKFACFMLQDREIVVASNHLARERFDIKAATLIDDLDLEGPNGQPFSEVVKSAIAERVPGSTKTPIAQAYSPSLKRRLDVAVLHIHVCALMGMTKDLILVSDAITPTTLDLFAEKFDLTPAEANIVHRFSSGQSINEIAEHRFRSVATVKTQFYKILEKCGAGSQGELLQMVARVESLTAATASMHEEFSHPHRRIFNIMRPGNRTLDVVSAGKPDGRPVISCNDFTFRTFPHWLEEELYQNNLKLYSVAPPGSGNTSPPLDGTSEEDCFAQDIISLLDNIGVERAVLIGWGSNLPLCLRVGAQLPERLTAIFSATPYAPAKRVHGVERTGWLPTFRDLTFGAHEALGIEISGAFFRLASRMGVSRGLRLGLADDKDLRDLMMRPDNFAAIKDAYDASMSQGVEFNTRTLCESLMEDWEADLAACPVPVHFAVGAEDQVGPVCAIEELAVAHRDKVVFTKVPEASSIYHFTHHEAFFSALKTAVEAA